MKNTVYSIIIAAMTFTFFGFLYPECVLLPDTYAYIEDGEKASKKDATADFYAILGAKSGEVTVKSGLLEALTNKDETKETKTCKTKNMEKKQETKENIEQSKVKMDAKAETKKHPSGSSTQELED